MLQSALPVTVTGISIKLTRTTKSNGPTFSGSAIARLEHSKPVKRANDLASSIGSPQPAIWCEKLLHKLPSNVVRKNDCCLSKLPCQQHPFSRRVRASSPLPSHAQRKEASWILVWESAATAKNPTNGPHATRALNAQSNDRENRS